MNPVTIPGSLLIGFDFHRGTDKGVLVVGTKTADKDVTILNAFTGTEAFELYKKLVTQKKPEGDPHVD